MKKASLWMLLVLAGASLRAARVPATPAPPPAQGSDVLAQAVADQIRQFSRDKYQLVFAVSRLENYTSLPDAAVQKLYQLIVARLESDQAFGFRDALLQVTNGRGDFNPRTLELANHLVYLRLVQNLDKTGVGVVIYSRRQDAIVSLRYHETGIPAGERALLVSGGFGFDSHGFSKLAELQPPAGLLDVCELAPAGGPQRVLFFYPDEIEVRQLRDNRLEKTGGTKLNWKRPFYPALHPEGRLAATPQGGAWLLAAGGNFSNASQILRLDETGWSEVGRVDFVVQAWLTLNATPYLAGARYLPGQNQFVDRILLQPAVDGLPAPGGGYEKRVTPFLAIDCNCPDGQLQSLQLVDTEYRLRQYSANFAEIFSDPLPRGGALAVAAGEWLACSDRSRGLDRVFFINILDGGWRPRYHQEIAGEIVFMRSGHWNNRRGFWIYVHGGGGGADEYRLQFWGKPNE